MGRPDLIGSGCGGDTSEREGLTMLQGAFESVPATHFDGIVKELPYLQ
jgi:hypothetical protein